MYVATEYDAKVDQQIWRGSFKEVNDAQAREPANPEPFLICEAD